MTTHTGRAFLNSCLKVPIDPCNNCPAPIYNRPKMYLGRLTTTTATPVSFTTKQTATTPLKTSDLDGDTIWTSTAGIRSLAKLYDSIPDYGDINHLPNEEFYSTLDTLRSTCCQLKTKPLNKCGVLEASSTTSSSLSSRCAISIGEKSQKPTKKKSAGSHKKCGGSSRKKSNLHKKMHDHNQESRCITETPSCSVVYKTDVVKRTKLRSFKEEFEDEVEAFKKTLKDYEEEFKRRPESVNTYRSKTMDFNSKESKQKNDEKLINIGSTKEVSEKMLTKPPASLCFREYLKKSFSFNDIPSISDFNDTDKDNHSRGLSKAETLIYKDRHKLSNYFMQKSRNVESIKTPSEGELPKIVIESPSSENVSSKSNRSGRRKKSRCKSQNDKFKVPFTLFEINSFKKGNSDLSTPSPVHPVARPNLAATLRAEVSKKKLKELQNKCTYYDTTPQFDWEVRKTPAWKTLSLNETHKEILLLRLATRKAEQALQKREYDLNMELMRQRVKSAPLLLEGTTYWGPNVGKLTHNCQREGLKHICQSNHRRQNRKKSAGTSCSHGGSRAMEEGVGGDGSECAVSLISSCKMHTLRKIYASNTKSHSRISYNHSRSGSKQKQHNAQDDDDLSSLDRAYL